MQLKIEHNSHITIDEAMRNSVPNFDQTIELAPETLIPTQRHLVLASDAQNGYFLTETNNNNPPKNYHTLKDLRDAGIESISILMEFTLNTSENAEEKLKKE